MSSSASPASSAAAAAAPSVPGTLLHAEGSATAVLSDAHIAGALTRALAALGPREKVLLVPPDFTRFHSNAGVLTQAAFTHYGAENVPDIMPALGTHAPMTKRQLEVMFDGGGLIPMDRFRVHDWRHDVVKIGEVPAEMVRLLSVAGSGTVWLTIQARREEPGRSGGGGPRTFWAQLPFLLPLPPRRLRFRRRRVCRSSAATGGPCIYLEPFFSLLLALFLLCL